MSPRDDEALDVEVEPAVDSDDVTVYFPRQPASDHEYDSGTPFGELALDDQGCLRFGDEDGPVITLPYEGYSVDLVDGEVALINEETSNVIANVGDEVSFHGSDPGYLLLEVPEHMLLDPVPMPAGTSSLARGSGDREGWFRAAAMKMDPL